MMRMPNGATYAPENCYDDPANCDMYAGDNNSYASYTNTNPPLPPPDFGTSPNQNTMLARRSMNGQQLRGNGTMNLPLPPYPDPPQPPLPPPRCGNDSANVSSSSNNDSTISAEISEAECDREHLVNRNYGGKLRIFFASNLRSKLVQLVNHLENIVGQKKTSSTSRIFNLLCLLTLSEVACDLLNF